MKLFLGLHLTLGLLIRLYYSLQSHRSGGYQIIRKRELSAVIITLGLFFTLVLTGLWIFKPEWIKSGQLEIHRFYQTAGMFFLVFHLILLFLSHRSLGHFWSGFIALRENHRVINRGIYRYLKHPMYLGVFCWILGLWLCCQNLWFLSLIFLAAGILIRIPREEKLLEKAEGETVR